MKKAKKKWSEVIHIDKGTMYKITNLSITFNFTPHANNKNVKFKEKAQSFNPINSIPIYKENYA